MDELVGRSLGPGGQYRLSTLLGHGGMSAVFQAEHIRLQRQVAIKILNPALTRDDRFVQRFQQEVKAIAHLEHAHIVPVYDYGQEDDLFYLVMRLVTGGTLKERFQHGGNHPWTPGEALDVARQVLPAIDYAHARNIVHRDIKPSNILLEGNHIFLADFGIAKLLLEDSGLTQSGMWVGTPAYMSPEQVLCEPLDGRADLYSFSIVLYELLTGRVPYRAVTPISAAYMHVQAVLPPPRERNPALAADVEAVIVQGLARERAVRPATGEALLKALTLAVTACAKEAATQNETINTSPQGASPPSVQASSAPLPSPSPDASPAFTPAPAAATVAPTRAPVPRGSSVDGTQERLALGTIGKAEALLQVGERDKALAELREASILAPVVTALLYAQTLLARGHANELAGHPKAALTDYRTALIVARRGQPSDELDAIIATAQQRIGQLERSSSARSGYLRFNGRVWWLTLLLLLALGGSATSLAVRQVNGADPGHATAAQASTAVGASTPTSQTQTAVPTSTHIVAAPVVPTQGPAEELPEAATTVPAPSSLLTRVRSRGRLICGVNGSLPGFGSKDASGNYVGFDVDYCRAIAAAIFGTRDAVEFRPLVAAERWAAIRTGEVDVLFRNSTWNAERDTKEGVDFGPTTFHDGQRLMVRAKTEIKTSSDLAGKTICVVPGTSTEQNLRAYFQQINVSVNVVGIEGGSADLFKAYDEEKCDAATADGSALYTSRPTLRNADDHVILNEVMSKEPLGPAFIEDDSEWRDVVTWSIHATIYAEELGVNQQNVRHQYGSTTDRYTKRLLGLEGTLGTDLGLEDDFVVKIIEQVGNYGDIFNRNLGKPTPFRVERGPNNLWYNGGLLTAPPF